MSIIVAKFGGTSVSSLETWENILKISRKHIHEGKLPVLVCSARSNASNMLEKLVNQSLTNQHQALFDEFTTIHHSLAKELGVSEAVILEEINLLNQWLTGMSLLKHAPAKIHAQVMSLGEIISTKIGQVFLKNQGLNCFWYDARQSIRTQNHSHDEFQNYCQARCEPKANKELQALFKHQHADVIITQGFIGSNAQNETVLLGRGGSDTSGALFASMLEAERCEIWTDVPGMYTANPHQLPQARLLKHLNYDEAQEIASLGAKVLHPLAIDPVRQAQIPMAIKYTWNPEHPGTVITINSDETAPPVKSIQIRSSITLIAMEANTMWQQSGFVAQAFQLFAKHHFSIGLISTSECCITVSIDGNNHNREALQKLLDELNGICNAKIIEPCSSISLIGHQIRRILPELGSTFELFNDQQVHLINLASNDLSLNIVVDESKVDQMTQQLHQLLIDNNPQSYYYSKSWQEEFNPLPEAPQPWWLEDKQKILALAKQHAPCYLYKPSIILQQVSALKQLKSVSQIFFAVKANFNETLLNTIYHAGLNFECVSIDEVKHLFKLFPKIERKRILFTPNFAHRHEYQFAIEENLFLTIDSLYPLEHWGDLLKHQSILLRIDPAVGAGHRKYVSTSGDESKFGLTLQDIALAKQYIEKHQIHVIGLHAHSGSGILCAELWVETAHLLLSLIPDFPHLSIINLGGGFGIAERPGHIPLAFEKLEDKLQQLKQSHPQIEFWIEPGRFIVAEAGILLARATQEKTKNKVRFVGLDVGMNSLIRPALYGSYHQILNLSRIDEPHKSYAHVVGPIGESMDTLGYDRMLPKTQENDIFVIANTGAYGYCMSSHYNLRSPAKEHIFDDV
jgi:diaminopimelate decarboxylase/aspartate kinase